MTTYSSMRLLEVDYFNWIANCGRLHFNVCMGVSVRLNLLISSLHRRCGQWFIISHERTFML